MSLMMRCIETYDAMEHLAGKCVNEDRKETLAPIGHILANATIEITVDEEGNFVRAQNVEKKAVIPCTEESASRSGTKKTAHPLCDQLGYVSSFYNEEKHKVYITELRKWVESKHSSKIIQAIYKYVTHNSIYEDLLSNGVKIKSEKDFVIWKPLPVEYKRGRSKISNCDRLQVAAQAVCLEEMFSCVIDYGFIFYKETRRREKVEITAEMRDELTKALEEMHSYYRRGYTPRVKPSKKCEKCSLSSECMPSLLRSEENVDAYIRRHMEESENA